MGYPRGAARVRRCSAANVAVMSDYGSAKMLQAIKDKGLKYAGVSVFNVILGQGLLLVFDTLWGWPKVAANFWAAVISAGPAYILSRAWVWNKKGKNSLFTEVLPFWGFAVLGLVISSVIVALTQNIEFKFITNLASLVGFGIVWVLKFFLLDALIFKVVHEHEAELGITPQTKADADASFYGADETA